MNWMGVDNGMRRLITALVAGHVVEWSEYTYTYKTNRLIQFDLYPALDSQLPAHKQLALSVLLGEDVPLSVLICALEDAGVFPDGVLQAVADKAVAAEREEQENSPPLITAQQYPPIG